jgi:tetratricopeptide (TPR) repeat protein
MPTGARDREGELVARWLNGQASLAEVRGYTEEELAGIAQVAFAYFCQGKYDHATILFDGLAAIAPRVCYYRKALGAVALARGEYDAALHHWDDAIRVDTSDAEAYLGRAEAYLGLGRAQDARADLLRAERWGKGGPLGKRATAYLKALSRAGVQRGRSAAHGA